MGASTIYDVTLRYMLNDRASAGLQRLERNTSATARATGALSRGFGRLAAVSVAGFGVKKLSDSLIGFNSGMEQAKTTMAGMIQLNMGGEWSTNMATATGLVGDFQKIAKASVGTTKDFVDMAQMLTRPVTAAGLGMKELKEMTTGAVVAARAFGVESQMAALDIEQALMGTLGKKDRFAIAILGPKLKEMNIDMAKFNALTADARANVLGQALGAGAIKDMANAQATTFAGVTSTLKDTIQMTLGKIGMPLFQAITAEVQKWNMWIERNEDKVAGWATKLGNALVGAFQTMKSIASFFVDHKDTLMSVAKAFLMYKASTMVGGMIGGVGGGMGRMTRRAGGGLLAAGLDKTGSRVASFGGMIGTATGVLGRLVPVIGLAAGALGVFTKVLGIGAQSQADKDAADRRKAAQKAADEAKVDPKLRAVLSRYEDLGQKTLKGERYTTLAEKQEMKDLAQQIGDQREEISAFNKKVLAYAVSEGLLTGNYLPKAGSDGKGVSIREYEARMEKLGVDGASDQLKRIIKQAGGVINPGTGVIEPMDRYERERFTKLLTDVASGAHAGSMFGSWADSALRNYRPDVDAALSGLPTGKVGKVNVTIQKIEVQSDDPDRFVFQMMSTFRDAARSPSGAVEAMFEG